MNASDISHARLLPPLVTAAVVAGIAVTTAVLIGNTGSSSGDGNVQQGHEMAPPSMSASTDNSDARAPTPATAEVALCSSAGLRVIPVTSGEASGDASLTLRFENSSDQSCLLEGYLSKLKAIGHRPGSAVDRPLATVVEHGGTYRHLDPGSGAHVVLQHRESAVAYVGANLGELGGKYLYDLTSIQIWIDRHAQPLRVQLTPTAGINAAGPRQGSVWLSVSAFEKSP